MTEPNPAPSGAEGDPAGGQPKPIVEPKSDDTVAYSTYKKVLTEKKNRDAELTEARRVISERDAKDKETEEENLKKNQQWQQLAEQKTKEAADAKEQAATTEKRLADGQKMSAVLDALDGGLDKQYWQLVDLDKVVLDPTTGLPEPGSVQAYVKDFREQYGKVLTVQNGPRLPNHAPRSMTKLTREEWTKLPLKEKKARMNEVMQNAEAAKV